jgi:L-alanine-DL-glutamate epimerase-like enolase superfamily enzyme
MKIVDVRTLILSCPLPRPVEMSFGRMTARTNAFVLIETDEGLTGIGETWTNFPSWAAAERRLTVEHGIKPLLVGQDPGDVLGLTDRMLRTLLRSGAGRQWGALGPLHQAVSGADIALWDLAGKRCGLPVHQLLGRTLDGTPGGRAGVSVRAYASGLGPREFEGHVESALARGYTAFKLKVGFGRDLDLANLRTIRGLIGDGARLMIDANQGWRDAAEALAHLRLYAEFGPEFIEEPVPADQLPDLRRIREASVMPVAGGENVYGRTGFRTALEARALDIVQPDLTKVGGLTEARAACDMAAAWGLPYAPHMYGTAVGLAASLQLMAAVPGGLVMEVDSTANPFVTDLLAESCFRFEAGRFHLDGEGPGLGIELNRDVVKEYEVH